MRIFWICLMAVLVPWVMVACDTPSGPTINVTGNNNDVEYNENDNDGGGDINTEDEGCCPTDGQVCYSIPSGTERDCSGCTLGVNCTLDPDDPLITGGE